AVSWKTPGEATDLHVYHTGLAWAPPSEPGASADNFDLIRATGPHGFETGTCVPVEPTLTTATDSLDPDAGAGFFYLVRARNSCPSGLGPLGYSSAGTPHTAPACP